VANGGKAEAAGGRAAMRDVSGAEKRDGGVVEAAGVRAGVGGGEGGGGGAMGGGGIRGGGGRAPKARICSCSPSR